MKDKIRIITPQFERTDGLKVAVPIKEDFDNLDKFSEKYLKSLGLQVWNKDPEKIHWLFPKEWYDHIPEGYKVVSIIGDIEKFQKGKTDDDIRFGALAYGFIQKLI